MTTINRAPWTALVDDSGNNLDGSIWNKGAIKDVLLDPIDASLATLDSANATQDTKLGLINTGVWTAYTPVWTGADNVVPVLGNGALSGRYVVIGKTCHFTVYLKPGTTTTFGTSTYWTWSLPLPAANFPNLATGCVASMVGPSGAAVGPGHGFALNTTVLYVITNAGGFVNPTVPFTWAPPNCTFYLRGTYEIA